MPSPRSVAILLGREVKDAWRNKWFLLYAGTFTLLALGLSWLSVTGVARTGYASLGRTAASLLNLVILIVPLMGLSLGVQAIVSERERGSLLYLLAQPVDVLEILLGKFLGISAAVLGALLLGFAVAAMAMSGRAGGGQVGSYLAFVGAAALLACATVSLGLLISTLTSRTSVAAGIGIFTWLILVFAGDLGLMGTALAVEVDVRTLLMATLANPLQVFKMVAVLILRGGLEALGPAGLYATRNWGGELLPLLAGILLLWIVVPLAVAGWTLKRRGGIP
ncbi:MAG: ABC transporter permease [Thermoanaerobaculia bacterium]|nr:ABC transporter permease [Thermoanaerobaculia bacterium]